MPQNCGLHADTTLYRLCYLLFLPPQKMEKNISGHTRLKQPSLASTASDYHYYNYSITNLLQSFNWKELRDKEATCHAALSRTQIEGGV